MDGISTLIKEAIGRSLAPSTTWGHSERQPSINQEAGRHQILNLLTP